MNEWNIQPRSHACQLCQVPFQTGNAYHTLLLEQKDGLIRSDVCRNCWEEQEKGSTDRKGFISHWQGVYEEPPPPAADAIHKDTAEILLRKLIALNDPKHEGACYILAVMLERKRLLKVKEQIPREEGGRIFVYEHPKTAEIFAISDPNLQLNQLEQVQKDVAQLMEHGAIKAGDTFPAGVASPLSSTNPVTSSETSP